MKVENGGMDCCCSPSCKRRSRENRMTFDDIQALDDTARIWPLRNTAMGISGSARMMEWINMHVPPCSVGLSRIQQTNQIGSTPPPGTASWHWYGALISTCCGSARAARSWSPAMSRPMLSLVIAVLLLGVGCLSAYAATFYVSTAGANSVTCAQAQNAQTPRRPSTGGLPACRAGIPSLSGLAPTMRLSPIIAASAGIPCRSPVGRPGRAPPRSRPKPRAAVTLRVTAPPAGLDEYHSVRKQWTTSQYILIEGFVLDWRVPYELLIGVTASHHLRFKDLEIKNLEGKGFKGSCDQLRVHESLSITPPEVSG